MKAMLMTLLVAAFAIGLAVPASATCGIAGMACGVKPFTAQTQYMSLQGYLRWKDYQDHLAWLTPKQAVKLVKDQLRACPPES